MDGIIDIRHLLLKEGLKAEESRECFILKQEVERLKQQLQTAEENHIIEREEIAKCYILECQKNEKLEEKVRLLNGDVADMKKQLVQKDVFCRSLIGKLSKCEKERDDMKRKYEKPEMKVTKFKPLDRTMEKIRPLEQIAAVTSSVDEIPPAPTAYKRSLRNRKKVNCVQVPTRNFKSIIPTPPTVTKPPSRYLRKRPSVGTTKNADLIDDDNTLPRIIRRHPQLKTSVPPQQIKHA